MLKRKLMILAIFFISLVAVSAVGAAENATDDIGTNEEAILGECKLNAVDEDVLSADVKTFKDLNATINGDDSNHIDLYDDYEYVEDNDTSFKKGIVINRENCTIDGHGNTIDGKAQARIFHIEKGDITFKNIRFINADMGAISDEGVDILHTLCLVNCIFTGNNADLYGIVFNSGNVSAVDCIFADNTVRDGEVMSSYRIEMSNCVFDNNNVVGSSSIIYCNYASVDRCIFTGNTARNIIYHYANAEKSKINNSVFINNDREYDICFNNNGYGEVNAYYNWFGGNATDYNIAAMKISPNVNCSSWLFLNATAIPDTVSILGTTDVVFKLFVYNSTSRNTTDYENTLLNQLDLRVSTTNGHVYEDTAKLGDAVRFAPDDFGTGSVTASIGNVQDTIEFDITAEDPKLSVESKEVYYSSNTMIALNYNAAATGKVNVTLKGKNFSYSFTDKELGVAISLGKVNPDEYNVTVIYSGDATFASSNATANLTVAPIVDVSVIITSPKDSYSIGDVVIWNVTVRNAANGTNATGVYMDIKLPNSAIEIFNWATDNGTCSQHIGSEYIWNIGFMGNGTTADLIIFARAKEARNETFLFAGGFPNEEDWNMSNNEAQKSVDVVKDSSTVNVADTVIDYGQTAGIEVATEGAIGFVAKIDDKNATVKGNTVMVPIMDAGTHTLTVTTIPDVNHTAASKTVKITVNKLKTQLVANVVTATYNTDKYLVVTLKDSKSKALTGFKVTVNLKGSKTYVTDKSGQIKVATKGLVPKAYTAKIAFSGNVNYVKSAKDVKVTVKKATPKLTAKKKTFKSSVKTKKYTIALKDSTGKAIKKAKVTLKVNGKTYKAKTNSKGKATFRISKLNNKGSYKAVIKYNGDKCYKKVTKKSKIKVIFTFKTVSEGSKDGATVKKIQQALKDRGYYLSYGGHYLKVDGIYESCTVRSVMEFQRDNGLKVTGKVDYKTAEKLKII